LGFVLLRSCGRRQAASRPFSRKWPFTQKRAKANAEKMAAAGFYYTGDEAFEDNVTCFMCAKVGAH
jgi:hypothetical protein